MTDYFALLNEPRRPWLEPDALKRKFLTLSASIHPDRVHNLGEAERQAAHERYAELNAAYNCLREPRDRLRHLLKLERGAPPEDIQRIPSDLMDLFMAIGQTCRQADVLLAEKAEITSPLLKAQWFERAQGPIDELQNLQQRLAVRRGRLTEELKRSDAEWNANSPQRGALLQRLEELYRLSSYFARWSAQVQERMAQLSF